MYNFFQPNDDKTTDNHDEDKDDNEIHDNEDSDDDDDGDLHANHFEVRIITRFWIMCWFLNIKVLVLIFIFDVIYFTDT